MSDLRSLTIIVAGPDPSRFHAALSLAAANAARNAPTRIFLQAEAASLLRPPLSAPQDARFSAAGMPTLDELLRESQELGVSIAVCQSGLSLARMTAEDLPAGVETSGLMAVLSGDPRLVVF